MKRFMLCAVLAAISCCPGCGGRTDKVVGVVEADSVSSTRPPAQPDRLASDPYMALRDEALYAIRQDWWNVNPAVCANGTVVKSNWNYLLSDVNAYGVIKAKYGSNASLWYGWPSYYTNMDVYSRTSLDRYGHDTGVVASHLGQCRGGANTFTYRSATYQGTFPGYNVGPFLPIAQAHLGSVIECYIDATHMHTAVVVAILNGVEGQSVSRVVVVDSNYVGDEEIGMHALGMSGGGVGNLANYRVLNLRLS